MKSKIFLGFVVASLAGALALGMLALLALRALNEGSIFELHRSAVQTMAQVVERGPLADGLKRYQAQHPDNHLLRGRIWVVGENGQVLASNTEEPLPRHWQHAHWPKGPHDLRLYYSFLAIAPSMTAVRLATTPPAYLITAPRRGSAARRRDLLEILFFGLALAFSVLLSLSLTFFYLRRKSSEAREVLGRLEHGDLKARFSIKHFDELGNLMLDFNRMASEIERLVGRLQEAEHARRSLFQELSHDLRTPLTSLRASIETLSLHWREMPDEHRQQILEVCQTETAYFMELLENLLFLAQMDEPRYKPAAEPVAVVDILESEVQSRQMQPGGKPQWELALPPTEVTIVGDPHLFRRLVKNALENAARFARQRVSVRLEAGDTGIELTVLDDGPGISAEEIAQFGKSRARRTLSAQGNAHVSLGLGSVIMTKITALHQGQLRVENAAGGGTRLVVRLPR